MLRELARPLISWLFWNRRRPVLALILLLAVIGLAGRLAGCGTTATQPAAASRPAPTAFEPSPGPAPSGVFTPSAAPTATATAAEPSQPSPAPSAATQDSAAPLAAARAFLTAWASRDASRTARIRAAATPRLAAEVTGPGTALAPVTRITGPVTVTSRTATSVNVTAPTDAGPALLTVRLAGGQWKAAQVTLAQAGD